MPDENATSITESPATANIDGDAVCQSQKDNETHSTITDCGRSECKNLLIRVLRVVEDQADIISSLKSEIAARFDGIENLISKNHNEISEIKRDMGHLPKTISKTIKESLIRQQANVGEKRQPQCNSPAPELQAQASVDGRRNPALQPTTMLDDSGGADAIGDVPNMNKRGRHCRGEEANIGDNKKRQLLLSRKNLDGQANTSSESATEKVDSRGSSDDSGGFKLVTYKKRKSPTLFGKRVDCMSLKAVEARSSIFVSRLDPATSEDEVKLHLETNGVAVSECSRLAIRSKDIAAFRVLVKRGQENLVLSESMWPANTIIRRYRKPSNFSTTNPTDSGT